MRTAAAMGSVVKAVGRQMFLGALAVATAVLGLALLAAALTTGGSAIGMPEFVSGAAEPGDAGPTIVATGHGQAGAPAETATIQILVGPGYGMGSGGPGFAESQGEEQAEELAYLTGALERAGVGRDALRIVASPFVQTECFSPTCNATRLDVTVRQPQAEQIDELVRAAAEAAREERISVYGIGVGYTIADCGPLQRQARELATRNARAQAEQQAEVLGLELGAMREASDVAVTTVAAGAAGACDVATMQAPVSPYDFYSRSSGINLTVPSYDGTRPAEATAAAQVSLTYEVTSP